MPTFSMGKVRHTPRGVYDPDAVYEHLDTVQINSATYECRIPAGQTISGVDPSTDTTGKWHKLLDQGDPNEFQVTAEGTGEGKTLKEWTGDVATGNAVIQATPFLKTVSDYRAGKPAPATMAMPKAEQDGVLSGFIDTDVSQHINTLLEDATAVHLPHGMYPIASPIAFKREGQTLVGEGHWGFRYNDGRRNGPVFKAIGSGWSGQAMIDVDGSTGTFNAISMQVGGFSLWGEGRDCVGLRMVLVGAVDLLPIRVETTGRSGAVLDGVWNSSLDSLWVRDCNRLGASDAGVVFSADSREISNIEVWNFFASHSLQRQVLFKDGANEIATMCFHGGLIEGAPFESADPLAYYCDIQNLRRSKFLGTVFNTESSHRVPHLHIGGSQTPPQNVKFFGTQHQTYGTTMYGIEVGNANGISFIEPVAQGPARFLDAATCPAGNAVTVLGNSHGVNGSAFINDPNGVVHGVDTRDLIVGGLRGFPRKEIFSRAPGQELRLGVTQTDGLDASLNLGTGASDNQAQFSGLYPVLPPAATAPANPASGTIANSNGSWGDGAGLHRWTGSTWKYIEPTT